MAETTSTGKLETFVKSIGWPLVAIVFMALFFKPISNWLGGLDKASEITVGVLGIKFDPSASKTLTPDSETADAVSKLSPDQLDFLLAHPFRQVHITCSPEQFNDKANAEFVKKQMGELNNWTALGDLGLAEFNEREDESFYCNPGATRAYELTEKGNITRSYVSRVATQLLKFEKKADMER